jgi:hypothetical protein
MTAAMNSGERAKQGLARRADQQHQQFMRGEQAGTHGDYPPYFTAQRPADLSGEHADNEDERD